MDNLYDYQGEKLDLGGIGGEYNVKGICHRGLNYSTSASGTFVINNEDGAPENTLPAYKLAAQRGFKYVETDVAFTSDGVPVLLHDATIDRTSNGSGDISTLTLAQAQSYIYNKIQYSGVDETVPGYADVTIPTFADFIKLCKDLSLHPYIELKVSGGYTEAQIQGVVDMVEAYGMKGKVTYISFDATYLGYVKNHDANARLGYLRFDEDSTNYKLNAAAITAAQNLRTGSNEVFISARTYTHSACVLCLNAGIPFETWGICNDDTKANIIGLDPYITGVTSNKWDAGKVLYENAIGS